LGFAIWARVHIGRNWGTPMTQKDQPELVTSGPYHLVRHPIYSGILVASVGTAVALSWFWLIAVGLAGQDIEPSGRPRRDNPHRVRLEIERQEHLGQALVQRVSVRERLAQVALLHGLAVEEVDAGRSATPSPPSDFTLGIAAVQ
jgi:hypothetical protein